MTTPSAIVPSSIGYCFETQRNIWPVTEEASRRQKRGGLYAVTLLSVCFPEEPFHTKQIAISATWRTNKDQVQSVFP